MKPFLQDQASFCLCIKGWALSLSYNFYLSRKYVQILIEYRKSLFYYFLEEVRLDEIPEKA